ncbi:MAG: FAD/NAD(P)-binding protein [bacterium]
MMESIYQPHIMTIEDIVVETPDVKTFRITFQNRALRHSFSFKPGQFGKYSIFGEGESTCYLASSPTCKGYLECSVKRANKVAEAFHKLEIGDQIGFRGPYGNWFPLEELGGKNLILIGSGTGLIPLRSLIGNCLAFRNHFGRITILYGAARIVDLIYKRELKEWAQREDVNLIRTVEPGGEEPGWDGQVGFVPVIMRGIDLSPEKSVAITCGPPVMVKFVIEGLISVGFSPEQVITTLESRIRCGLGKCGRCTIGNHYVCQEGPVFTYAQISEFPNEF